MKKPSFCKPNNSEEMEYDGGFMDGCESWQKGLVIAAIATAGITLLCGAGYGLYKRFSKPAVPGVGKLVKREIATKPPSVPETPFGPPVPPEGVFIGPGGAPLPLNNVHWQYAINDFWID